jgi:tRNA (guanine-N7-)-methyltransferase
LPHIYVKDFNKSDFKNGAEFGDVRFHHFGKSLKSDKNSILFVEFRDKRFFLELKERDERVLIKSEKSNRPSPNYPVHRAIDSFSQMMNLHTLSSNLNLKESQHIAKDSYLKDIDFFRDMKLSGRVEVEIGFGSGRHILHRAEESPDTTFIGIEIHKPSIEQALKQIEIRRLKNLYILDFDARHFLEILPSNSLSTIYVHFPVPWDKKPHRRIIQPIFLKEAKRVLELNGVLELRTDSENYFQSALQLFTDEPLLKMELLKNISIDVQSKYESRWLKMEKNIYNFRITNLEDSAEKRDFYISTISEVKGDSPVKLLGETILKENWFINFKDIYQIDNSSYILSIVAGSYSYPENIFLLLNGNKIEYLIKKPLELEVNVEIDKYLRELL